MQEILIACGDTDLLRQIVADLPPDQFKPIATRKGDGIAAKVSGRGIRYAIIHEALADGTGAVLCQALKNHSQPPSLLYLVEGEIPEHGPFDAALKYPVPGPVFRNSLKRILDSESPSDDMERWRAFFNEVQTRRAALDSQSYYQMLGLKPGAPHHLIVQVFDALSLRYHPDRYQKHRGSRWGDAVYEQVNELYKVYTQAYSVLADRRLKQKYDEALMSGELRIPLEDIGADTGPRSLLDLSNHPSAKKFLKLGQTDLARGQTAQAIQNLRFALSVEPDNTAIAAKIAELDQNKG